MKDLVTEVHDKRARTNVQIPSSVEAGFSLGNGLSC